MYTWILQVKSLEHSSGPGVLTQVLEVRPETHELFTSLRWHLWSTGMQRCLRLLSFVRFLSEVLVPRLSRSY